MSKNFVSALLTEKKADLSLKEGHILLTYTNGRSGQVEYTYAKKSQETLDAEFLEEEKRLIEEDVNYQMTKAIIQMEIRRDKYRAQDIIDYGYDKYTEEFYYEPEKEEDEDV
jgi:signal recognition particle GTPase